MFAVAVLLWLLYWYLSGLDSTTTARLYKLWSRIAWRIGARIYLTLSFVLVDEMK